MKILASIFLFAILIRFLSVWPTNTIIGFDQARDLFLSKTIYQDFDLKIIGPTAGNNPNLHHGVLFLYYMIPPLILFGGNPIFVVLYNSVFNAFAGVILYFFAKDLFKNKLAGFVSAFIAAVSYEFINYAGWLSNPTPTIFTVPLFYFGFWKYYQKKNWGLPLCFLALGLSIQFELFFIYLVPIFILSFVLLRPSLPTVKNFLFSVLLFSLSTSTMILTEIKFKFAGVFAIIFAGSSVGGERPDFFYTLKLFLDRFFNIFSLNLFPTKPQYGFLMGIFVISFLFLSFYRAKTHKDKKPYIFVLIYLFSPFITLFLGYHNAPWFLIGLPPVVVLSSSLLISQIKPVILVFPVLFFVCLSNLFLIRDISTKGQTLLGPDSSAIMTNQLAVIDYTYESSKEGGVLQPFSINTVTNPLYVNAVWAYHYEWHGGGKYKYLPTFSGGDQLYPYNTLEKFKNSEKYLYLIIDKTPRIPYVHTLEAVKWADSKSTLLEEITFSEILIQKRLLKKVID